MSYIEPKPSPEEDIYFGGLVIRATDETHKRIKEFIVNNTNAKIIYQKKSVAYLKITPATQEPPINEASYSIP